MRRSSIYRKTRDAVDDRDELDDTVAETEGESEQEGQLRSSFVGSPRAQSEVINGSTVFSPTTAGDGFAVSVRDHSRDEGSELGSMRRADTAEPTSGSPVLMSARKQAPESSPVSSSALLPASPNELLSGSAEDSSPQLYSNDNIDAAALGGSEGAAIPGTSFRGDRSFPGHSKREGRSSKLGLISGSEANAFKDRMWLLSNVEDNTIKVKKFSEWGTLREFFSAHESIMSPTGTKGLLVGNLTFVAESSSSSSSSDSSSDDDKDHGDDLDKLPSHWLDVQVPRSSPELLTLLELFPLDQTTIDDIVAVDPVDAVVSEASYVFMNIMAKPLPAGDTSKEVCLSAIVFRNWLITIHEEPFAGLASAVKRIQHAYFHHRKRRGGGGAAGGSGSGALAAAAAPRQLSISWILAVLVDFVVDTTLPDPTPLLTSIDQVDEMVLMLAGDQQDLLRRLALLRRKVASQRLTLYRKEKLVRVMLSPAMRHTHAAKAPATQEQYKQTHGHIQDIAERLNAARDTLNQANSNFSSKISIQMTQLSNDMNAKMQMLSQVTSVCLPLNIVTGAMGMNCSVPFNATAFPDTLVPFFVICVIMLLWLAISFPAILRSFYKRKETSTTAFSAEDEELN